MQRMRVKLKICSGPCDEFPKVIWRRIGREGYCKKCWLSKQVEPTSMKRSSLPRSIKPIKKQSDKRKKEDILYSTMRKVFLDQHQICQAGLSGCTIKSQDIHHLFWGKDRSKYMNDFSEVKAVCRNCHTKIHSELSLDEAKKLGLKK